MRELMTDDFLYDTVQLCNTIAGLSVTLAGVSQVVVALIAAAYLAPNCTILLNGLAPAGGQCQTVSAVPQKMFPTKRD